MPAHGSTHIGMPDGPLAVADHRKRDGSTAENVRRPALLLAQGESHCRFHDDQAEYLPLLGPTQPYEKRECLSSNSQYGSGAPPVAPAGSPDPADERRDLAIVPNGPLPKTICHNRYWRLLTPTTRCSGWEQKSQTAIRRERQGAHRYHIGNCWAVLTSLCGAVQVCRMTDALRCTNRSSTPLRHSLFS